MANWWSFQKRVMQTKSSESMSLIWCLMATVTAFQWTIYGYLQDDQNITVSPSGGLRSISQRLN